MNNDGGHCSGRVRLWPSEKRTSNYRGDIFSSHTQLDAIQIESDGSLTPGYSFATDGIWDDATLNVGLKTGCEGSRDRRPSLVDTHHY